MTLITPLPPFSLSFVLSCFLFHFPLPLFPSLSTLVQPSCFSDSHYAAFSQPHHLLCPLSSVSHLPSFLPITPSPSVFLFIVFCFLNFSFPSLPCFPVFLILISFMYYWHLPFLFSSRFFVPPYICLPSLLLPFSFCIIRFFILIILLFLSSHHSLFSLPFLPHPPPPPPSPVAPLPPPGRGWRDGAPPSTHQK